MAVAIMNGFVVGGDGPAPANPISSCCLASFRLSSVISCRGVFIACFPVGVSSAIFCSGVFVAVAFTLSGFLLGLPLCRSTWARVLSPVGPSSLSSLLWAPPLSISRGRTCRFSSHAYLCNVICHAFQAFMNDANSFLINAKLEPTGLESGGNWAVPEENHLRLLLGTVFRWVLYVYWRTMTH